MREIDAHGPRHCVCEFIERRVFMDATFFAAGEKVAIGASTTVASVSVQLAPASIRGWIANGHISDGSFPFGKSGTFQFRAAKTGNTYVIIGGSGVANSSGDYEYNKLSSTKAEILLSDTVLGLVGTQTLTFNSSTSATYRLIGNGRFQKGTLSFSDPLTAYISGYVYKDTNQNGTKDASERGWAGRTVFIDKDGDNKLDTNERTATTDSAGHYKISKLRAGTYRLQEVVPGKWKLTQPIAGYYNVSLSIGQVSKKHFGNTPVVSAVQSDAPIRQTNFNSTFRAENGVASTLFGESKISLRQDLLI